METRIVAVGNSHGLRIPKALLEQARLAPGDKVRIGVESGEVVVDSVESTFATGDALNIAARLQQAAPPNTIMIGPGERYTVLINPNEVGTWVWHCHILNHVERDTGMFGMVTALIVE